MKIRPDFTPAAVHITEARMVLEWARQQMTNQVQGRAGHMPDEEIQRASEIINGHAAGGEHLLLQGWAHHQHMELERKRRQAGAGVDE